MSNYKAIILMVTIDKNILVFDTEDGSVPHSKAICKYAIENSDLLLKSR